MSPPTETLGALRRRGAAELPRFIAERWQSLDHQWTDSDGRQREFHLDLSHLDYDALTSRELGEPAG